MAKAACRWIRYAYALAQEVSMQLSRTIAYAVHATLHLARAEPGVPIPCSRLAHIGNMPERFLLQVLRSLVTCGLLRSARGVEGGYCLARPPSQITLRDIVEAFDDTLEPSAGVFDVFSPQVRERMISTLKGASLSRQKELQKLSIAELLSAEKEHGPHASFRSTASLEPPAREHGR